MNTKKLLEEIREANLNYLLLAQSMIHEDSPTAQYRLGMSEEVASLVGKLAPSQLMKMASSNTLLCRFRYDDMLILNMLVSHGKEQPMAASHAAILAVAKPVEAIA